MADFSSLIASIEATIKENHTQAITGQILQDELLAMIAAINQLKQDTLEGFAFYGEPLADGGSATVTQNTFFLVTAGTYTINGNTFAVTGRGVSVVVYDTVNDEVLNEGLILPFDNAPTEGSSNPVTSGGAYTALAGKQALVPAATNGNLAEFDAAGQVKDAGKSVSDLAPNKGVALDLLTGFTPNLVDTRSAGTHQGPFAFRQSGGDGVNYMRKILGRTEAFNQLIDPTTAEASKTENGITFTKNGDGTISVSGTASAQATYLVSQPSLLAGHKYYLAGCPSGGSASTFSLYLSEGATAVDYGGGLVVDAAPGGAARIRIVVYSGAVISTPVVFKPQFADLTLEGLGLTTADQFRALHPLPYYAYNAGVLKNNAATGIKTRGFNQWDEEWERGSYDLNTGEPTEYVNNFRSKNPIKVVAGLYYMKTTYSAFVFSYNAEGNYLGYSSIAANGDTFTPKAGAAYILFTVGAQGADYNHDICINLSWSGYRNGEYEPYEEHTLALPLNAIACHNGDEAVTVNGLDGVGSSYDEAVVENGMVTKINKRRKRVNLGALSWSYTPAGSGTDAFFEASLADIENYAASAIAPLVCSKYAAREATAADTPAKGVGIGAYTTKVRVFDTAYSDATVFTAAMNGVYLDYPLATPKVLTVDNPFPAFVEVDNLGTEERLPADTAADPQGPFESDSNYSISVANLVRKLSE